MAHYLFFWKVKCLLLKWLIFNRSSTSEFTGSLLTTHKTLKSLIQTYSLIPSSNLWCTGKQVVRNLLLIDLTEERLQIKYVISSSFKGYKQKLPKIVFMVANSVSPHTFYWWLYSILLTFLQKQNAAKCYALLWSQRIKTVQEIKERLNCILL